METQPHRAASDIERLVEICDRFDRLRVLVIGDVMLDEYLWGDVDRVSPEAPVPVVRIERETSELGGAGNVARNLLALGGECVLCGVVGEDTAGRRTRELVSELGLDRAGLVLDAARSTSRKTRIVARGRQMLRVDRESEEPISTATRRQLSAAAMKGMEGLSGVILADYAKGTLPAGWVRKLMKQFGEAGLPVAVDPKHEMLAYRGAGLLKPNREEAVRLSGSRIRGSQDLCALVVQLQHRMGGVEIALTAGAAGMVVCGCDGVAHVVPVAQRDVFDVQGAGDTSMAALWLARLAGADLVDAARIANAAAGVVIGKMGTATANRDELRERLLAESVEFGEIEGRR